MDNSIDKHKELAQIQPQNGQKYLHIWGRVELGTVGFCEKDSRLSGRIQSLSQVKTDKALRLEGRGRALGWLHWM